MRLFAAYLKQRVKVLVAFALFCVIFAIIFGLYRLPLGAVIYPAVLCAILGAVFVAFDFASVWRRHKQLCTVKELTAAMITELPDGGDIIEHDYQEIIGNLKKELADLENLNDIRYRDTVEYYTVWAHQIKTPIAAMRLTLQGEDSPFSRRLSSDLFRIEQYVDMVLAFIRLDSPSHDYVFRKCSADDIIKGCVRRFSSEFIDKRIRLEYEPTELQIVTDEKWLSFVIEQILSNALKYTKSGSVKIYLERPKILCIEDTGIGIAPEDLPRIFENGYTGYNGRSDKKASGIGLYLCRRICDNLGVGISAESELDKGTVIRLDLEQYEMKKE